MTTKSEKIMTTELAAELVGRLTEKHMTVSAAESCTGGLIAASIISAAGASAVINESFVTYSNEAKEKYAGVSHKTLEEYGAVSKETVTEMTLGCAQRAGADMAIASSGIAGPGGGTEEKPVGLVYIGCCIRGKIEVQKNIFDGDRQQVRQQTVIAALKLAIDMIGG